MRHRSGSRILTGLAFVLAVTAVGLGDGGDLLWDDQFNNEGDGDDDAEAVAVKGKRVFVVGQSRHNGNQNWMVRAYDSKTGQDLWFDNSGHRDNEDDAEAVVVKGKTVFVAGSFGTDNDGRDWYVRAYNAKDGVVKWSDQFDESGLFDRAVTMAVKGKRLFVAGTIDAEGSQGGDTADWQVRAYDTKTGEILWTKQHDEAGGEDVVSDRPLAVAGGAVLVAGHVTNGNRDEDWMVRAYDIKTGDFLWEDQIDDGGQDDAAAGVAAKGSRAFAVGCLQTNDNVDAFIRAYKAKTGEQLWDDRVDKLGDRDDFDVVAVKGSRVFAAGEFGGDDEVSGNAESGDHALIMAYKAKDGSDLWDDGFDVHPPGTDARDDIDSIAVLGRTVFVAGEPESTPGENVDLMVRAYNGKTGVLLWEDLFDLAGGDDFVEDGWTLAAGGGRVFAAVQSNTGPNDEHQDWIVRAYDAQ